MRYCVICEGRTEAEERVQCRAYNTTTVSVTHTLRPWNSRVLLLLLMLLFLIELFKLMNPSDTNRVPRVQKAHHGDFIIRNK